MKYKINVVRLFVTHLDAALAFYSEILISRGASFIEPPEKQSWGGVLAHVQDPDGNVLTLLGA